MFATFAVVTHYRLRLPGTGSIKSAAPSASRNRTPSTYGQPCLLRPRDKYLGLASLAAGCGRRQLASFLRSCETSPPSFCTAAAVARGKKRGERDHLASSAPLWQRRPGNKPRADGNGKENTRKQRRWKCVKVKVECRNVTMSDVADSRPDLLVGVRVTTSPGGHQAFILEEDEDELDLTDPKSEDDSREVDLSVDASDSSSSLNPESSSPLNGGPPGSSPTAQQEDVVGSPLANLPEDGVDEEETPTPPVRGESRRGGSSVQIVDLLTSPLEEGLGSPGARVNGTAAGQSIAECISYQVTTPDEAESRPEAIPEEEEEISDDGLGGVSSAVQELASFVGESADAPQDDQFVDYVVSTPEDEDDSACNVEDNFTSPVPDMSRETSSAMSSDMDTSSRTTSVETVACASPLNPQQDTNVLRSPQGGEGAPLSPDRRDESLDPTRSPNNLCTTPVLACSPTDTAEAADSPELESSEDEFEYTPAGVTKSSVTKSKRVVASARTSSKEGITLQQSSITSTSRVDSHTEVVTGKGGGAYDGLNGVTEKTELTNGTDDDYYRPEIECPVSVSKLKCQYERTIKENGILSPTREVISTGIDFESLKHSYISPPE
ncbi:hypothetical protein MTO96_047929 [Rhipicephalus appendiculatus]